MMRALGESPAPFMANGCERLDAALASPQWARLHAHADLATQAALLAIRIAQAHPLMDNNKRLAYMVGVTFLRVNGHALPAEHSLTFAKQIEAVIDHVSTVDAVAKWLRGVIELPKPTATPPPPIS